MPCASSSCKRDRQAGTGIIAVVGMPERIAAAHAKPYSLAAAHASLVRL
jgi:hypothetical protein